MTSSQHPLGTASIEDHLPLGPVNFEIRSSTNRLNPETQHEETYYLLRFPDFDNEEKEFSETELMTTSKGVEAVLKYNGSSPTTKEALQSPRRTSRRTSFGSSPSSSVRRASEFRSSSQARNTIISLPPQSTRAPQSLEIEKELPLDALQWAGQNYTNLPVLPEWQRSMGDRAPPPLGVDSARMVRFEHVVDPSWASPEEGVATVELPGRVLIKFHNGHTALLAISEPNFGRFTTGP